MANSFSLGQVWIRKYGITLQWSKPDGDLLMTTVMVKGNTELLEINQIIMLTVIFVGLIGYTTLLTRLKFRRIKTEEI